MMSFETAVFEFHVSRRARDRYQFDLGLFSTTGNVILANFLAARQFAHKINAQRDLVRYPDQAVQAGQINAMGLIDEIMHQVFRQYRRRYPQVMQGAIEWVTTNLGHQAFETTLRHFVDDFPPLPVYRNELTVEEYLNGETDTPDGERLPNRQIALEEMLMLWLANENPAFRPFRELFDDTLLEQRTAYRHVINQLYHYFETQPRFGPQGRHLLDLLLAPARAHPDSLIAQLEFLGQQLGDLLGDIRLRLLTSLDLVKEETKPVFAGGGPGPAPVLEFTGADYYDEPERFSADLDWMPNLVLLAKNTYVWLDQLSRKYQRAIHRLDQVPMEELEQMRRWGITGLWLIGLWERSIASQRIKQMRGNADAVASAYSLYSYDIAADLGGDEAYQVLRNQAWKCGIRLAADMVPNHMGIDSRWVIEHPTWFVQLPYSPFPTYTFNGPNLSWDERVGIFLEDHYYDSTDAAVVFKRVDFWTGESRYIYHGNDGTSMPWNDTAQLNYLLPEVREAVIQTILHVARKFPVIRFDAAMTLAKRHYHRLWFPEPGTGGDIASRAEYGLTKAQFDEAFPEEFWRQVVDRVAQEAPDTLLLAEAFWLMEGYFVRTLGMHRVYNSAFMNMLRDEKNQEYRQVIKNTLEFEPEVLKRYVNFMNNPDERTAVDQFGKGDKYFGVCTMLVTLPGLPMLGHGQIEGFTEKYGMEFRYPKWHEQADLDLVKRHEREIFPLLRKRYLFADADNFRLYDFYMADGHVNEDVFAYSNRVGDEASLVVYQNRFAEAHGWLNLSAAFPEKTGNGDEKILVQHTLSQELRLSDAGDQYVIFREHMSGLEYLRPSAEICRQGLYLELNAYRCLVFLDFRQVQDTNGHYARLSAQLAGRGTPSVAEALLEMTLAPILNPLRELVNPGMLDWLMQNRLEAESYEAINFQLAIDEIDRKLDDFLQAVVRFASSEPEAQPPQPADVPPDQAALDEDALEALEEAIEAEPNQLTPSKPAAVDAEAELQALKAEVLRQVRAALSLNSLSRDLSAQPAEVRHAIKYLLGGPNGQALAQGKPAVWGLLLSSLLLARLGCLGILEARDQAQAAPQAGVEVFSPDEAPVERTRVVDVAGCSQRWLDEWLLGKQVAAALVGMGVDKHVANRAPLLLRVLVGQQGCLETGTPEHLSRCLLSAWIEDDAARRYLLVHPYQGIEWYNKEAYEDLVWWTYALGLIQFGSLDLKDKAFVSWLRTAHQTVLRLLSAEERSQYQVDKLTSK